MVIYKRGKRKPWIQSKSSLSGVCFTISWDRFEEILKTGKLPEAFPNWKFSSSEKIEKLKVDENGVTVYISNSVL